MKYAALGDTGINVSGLCFGTLTMGPLQAALPIGEGAEIIAHAIINGVNFFDTAQLYGTYPYLREGMRIAGKDDIVISSKTYAWNRELAIEAIEEARRELGRDVIDIFLLHEQESELTLRGHREALEALYEYKARGVIRAVGASMHCVAAVEGSAKLGMDVIHPLMNVDGLGIQDGSAQDMEKTVKAAREKGVGVFSMKPLGGGNLLRKAEESLQYALGLPYVDSIAIGIQSKEELDANLHFWDKGVFSEEDAAALKRKVRHLHIESWCTGCAACVGRCGQNALSVAGEKAICKHEDCILCGYCSTVCGEWAIKVV